MTTANTIKFKFNPQDAGLLGREMADDALYDSGSDWGLARRLKYQWDMSQWIDAWESAVGVLIENPDDNVTEEFENCVRAEFYRGYGDTLESAEDALGGDDLESVREAKLYAIQRSKRWL